MSGRFDEFTETGFRRLVRQLVTGGYRFAKIGYAGADRHVLWRHDVDVSVHRALALARIEADEGATATYYINPRAVFYNVLEPGISSLISEIVALGHEIGLHFDGAASGVMDWQLDQLEEAVTQESRLLETLLDCPIGTVSWHNPDMSNLLQFGSGRIAGLQNAYSNALKRDYTYCSDSNGYWRFEPMSRVIAASHDRLYLLTHPEWWTPEPMSPSDRIDRALLGRARRNREQYDAILSLSGRTNLTS